MARDQENHGRREQEPPDLHPRKLYYLRNHPARGHRHSSRGSSRVASGQRREWLAPAPEQVWLARALCAIAFVTGIYAFITWAGLLPADVPRMPLPHLFIMGSALLGARGLSQERGGGVVFALLTAGGLLLFSLNGLVQQYSAAAGLSSLTLQDRFDVVLLVTALVGGLWITSFALRQSVPRPHE